MFAHLHVHAGALGARTVPACARVNPAPRPSARPPLRPVVLCSAASTSSAPAPKPRRRARKHKDHPTAAAPPPSPLSSALEDTVEVEFWIKYHTYWGESLRVVGSCASLGSWSPSRAPRMEWQGGGMWRLRAAVPRAAGLVEYKYLVAEHDTGNARSWQGGGNAVLAVGAAEAQLQVYDSWGGEPGAPVLQKGLKPTTKEASLLAWAAAAEKRVFAGSAELRAARAELQAARETAQRAQKEVERLTLALEASEEAKRELQARLDAATRQLEAQSHTSSSAPPAPPTSAASPARALVGELTFGSAPHGSSPGLPVRAQHERQSLVPGRVLGKAL